MKLERIATGVQCTYSWLGSIPQTDSDERTNTSKTECVLAISEIVFNGTIGPENIIGTRQCQSLNALPADTASHTTFEEFRAQMMCF